MSSLIQSNLIQSNPIQSLNQAKFTQILVFLSDKSKKKISIQLKRDFRGLISFKHIRRVSEDEWKQDTLSRSDPGKSADKCPPLASDTVSNQSDAAAEETTTAAVTLDEAIAATTTTIQKEDDVETEDPYDALYRRLDIMQIEGPTPTAAPTTTVTESTEAIPPKRDPTKEAQFLRLAFKK